MFSCLAIPGSRRREHVLGGRVLLCSPRYMQSNVSGTASTPMGKVIDTVSGFLDWFLEISTILKLAVATVIVLICFSSLLTVPAVIGVLLLLDYISDSIWGD